MNPIRNYMIEQRKIVIDEIDNKTTEISNRVKHRWNFISFRFYLCISVASSLSASDGLIAGLNLKFRRLHDMKNSTCR